MAISSPLANAGQASTLIANAAAAAGGTGAATAASTGPTATDTYVANLQASDPTLYAQAFGSPAGSNPTGLDKILANPASLTDDPSISGGVGLSGDLQLANMGDQLFAQGLSESPLAQQLYASSQAGFAAAGGAGAASASAVNMAPLGAGGSLGGLGSLGSVGGTDSFSTGGLNSNVTGPLGDSASSLAGLGNLAGLGDLETSPTAGLDAALSGLPTGANTLGSPLSSIGGNGSTLQQGGPTTSIAGMMNMMEEMMMMMGSLMSKMGINTGANVAGLQPQQIA